MVLKLGHHGVSLRLQLAAILLDLVGASALAVQPSVEVFDRRLVLGRSLVALSHLPLLPLNAHLHRLDLKPEGKYYNV